MRGLIADIGATNARFALADSDGIYQEKNLTCKDFPNLDDAMTAYLKDVGEKVARASVAIAGPVNGDWFEMTNHHWKFSIETVRRKFNLENFRLMNDFEAIARAIPVMNNQYLVTVGGGEKQERGTIGIVGPGTGLGVAALFWSGGAYQPNPCEGGHITMPVKTQREFDIFQYLLKKYSHVSAERVCSGKGLVNVYLAICAIDGRDDLPQEIEPEEISLKAQEKSCDVCVETLDKMMGFLGTIAGNLAVTLGAHGGIYIAGGIPAKLGDTFLTSRFRQEFEDKGRMSGYIKRIPTYLITHPTIAFVGLQADLSR